MRDDIASRVVFFSSVVVERAVEKERSGRKDFAHRPLSFPLLFPPLAEAKAERFLFFPFH